MKVNSRRAFLKKLGWGIPASYFLPRYLISCKDEELFSSSYGGHVAVIGGGVAGLHAASILQRHGANVTIFEASDRLGGRVRSEHAGNASSSDLFVNSPIELGADRIYGKNTLFYEAMRTYTANIGQLRKGVVYAYLGENVEEREGYKKYIELEASLAQDVGQDCTPSGDCTPCEEKEDTPESDCTPCENSTLLAFISKRQEKETCRVDGDEERERIRNLYGEAGSIWDNILGEEYGLSISQLTVSEYLSIRRDRLHAQDRYHLQVDPITRLLQAKYRDLDRAIRYNAPVSSIDYSGQRVRITAQNEDEPIEVDKVIIATPVGVLSRGDIAFTPDLLSPDTPGSKSSALQAITMNACAKIFLKFTQPFWPANTGIVYTNSLFKVMITHPSEHVLMGYAYGRDAITAENLDSEAGNVVIDSIDEAFEGAPRRYFQRAKLVTWTDSENATANMSPFIPGAYSYELPGMSGMRAALGASVDGKLYFAGEATHTKGHANTVHGAMETGYRAAYEILNSA